MTDNAQKTDQPAEQLTDKLASLVPMDVQRQAARMAQDAFAQLFRLTVAGDEESLRFGLAEMQPLIRNWAQAGVGDEARSLRLALMMSGLDQWGLAYSQAFGLNAIPGLTELLGALRTALSVEEDARLQQMFEVLEHESDAIDFKVDLRRSIHLALWHALIASEDKDEATSIGMALGSMMLGLTQSMPTLGWRLVADALAYIQIRCLSDGLAVEGLAQEMTQQLFASLSQALPKETRDQVFAQAAQVAMAWQQARRQGEMEAAEQPTRH
ncbi:MAG TPA: hypothetical protein VFW68_14185 [Rhodocyclaceae bacterium]|nr:hypothetical protein [Rhodocyclaceae bacterium]